MNALEWRATGSLAGLYMARMLGLFMVLPVLTLYARDLPGATWVGAGLALGIYGLTQAALQLPFGIASDRVGRKPMILAGLVIFAAGSLLAATANDINWLIAGRALQGAGAVGAVVNALLADLTREAERTKAMLVLGVGIGASFILGLIL
ncbi:MAG: MFS transporter, partial [Salinisphaera sp.]|nr:MFS transporter [Salinisphaera sp.]